MDKLLTTFVDIIVAIFQAIYTIISAVAESAAQGNFLACAVLIGILMPFAFAFLRLAARRSGGPARRPRGRR